MVPRENKNNVYAKFGGTNKDYYGIFRSGLLQLGRGLRFSCNDRTVEVIKLFIVSLRERF